MHHREPHELGRVYCTELRNTCRRWIEEIATIVEATLTLSEPESILPSHCKFALGVVEPADEVLIARDHHHDDEAGDQRRVDEPQHLEDRVGLVDRENDGPQIRTASAKDTA